MARQVQVLILKARESELNPGTHINEDEENQDHKVVP